MHATGGKIGEGDWIPRVLSLNRIHVPLPPVSSRVTIFLFSSVRAPDKKSGGENTHRGGKKRGKGKKEKEKEKRKMKRGEKRESERGEKGNVEQEIDDKKKEEEG